jgi:hypothetical protein
LRIARLIERHGENAKLPDLRRTLAGDYPRVGATSIYERCGVRMLSRLRSSLEPQFRESATRRAGFAGNAGSAWGPQAGHPFQIVEEPVFYQGQVVGETRRYSDTLAMFILKSKRREVWGERQEIQVKDDWSLLSIEERERRALKLLDMWDEIKERRAERERLRIEGLPPIVYDPTDGDELAAREAKERARAQSDDDDSPGGIGR